MNRGAVVAPAAIARVVVLVTVSGSFLVWKKVCVISLEYEYATPSLCPTYEHILIAIREEVFASGSRITST
jgi:hypothetical protein